jgi:hypothetical protein
MLQSLDVRYIRDTMKEMLAVLEDFADKETYEGLEPDVRECLEIMEAML